MGATKARRLVLAFRKDQPGKCPDMLPKDFASDAIALQRMHAIGTALLLDGTACRVHGKELQDQMAARYPLEWMLWLADEMRGLFEDDDSPGM